MKGKEILPTIQGWHKPSKAERKTINRVLKLGAQERPYDFVQNDVDLTVIAPPNLLELKTYDAKSKDTFFFTQFTLGQVKLILAGMRVLFFRPNMPEAEQLHDATDSIRNWLEPHKEWINACPFSGCALKSSLKI